MSNRLPTVGGDFGNWGSVLTSYLLSEHNADGTHSLSTGLVTDVVNTQSSVGSAYSLPPPTTAGINYLTLTASCTLTFPTAVAGQSFTLVLKQGGTGSYTVIWPAGIVKWENGAAPALTTAVGGIDVFAFLSVDGANWFGFASGQNIK